MDNEKQHIELWYEGLGRAYHLSRGPMGALGCYDAPTKRRIAYGAVSIILAGMAFTCAAAAWVLRQIPWVPHLCALVAVIALLVAAAYLNAYRIVTKAQSGGANPDLVDPIRRKAIRQAYRWGIKNKKIRRDPSGREKFVG